MSSVKVFALILAFVLMGVFASQKWLKVAFIVAAAGTALLAVMGLFG